MDDEPLILEIDITGGMAAQQQMEAVTKSMKAMQAPMSDAADKTQKLSRNLMAADGPAQRLRRSLTQLRQAAGSGDPSAMFDAQYKVLQAQKAYNRANGALNPKPPVPPSFFDKLKGVITSSRFGAGGLLPLVGKTLDLLGVGATVAAAGIKLLWDAASRAAESLTAFRQSMLTSGGTAGETAQLLGVGKAAGISDPAGLSRALSEALKDNGEGTVAGGRIGIHDYGGALTGPADKAANLLKVLDTIGNRNKTTDEEALRLARALHVEQALIYRDVSATTKEQIKQAALSGQVAHGPEAQRNAAEFNAQMGILGTNLDSISTSLGSSVLPVFTDLMHLVNVFGPGLSYAATAFGAIVEATNKLGPLHLIVQVIDAIRAMTGADGKSKSSPIDENTQATKENTAALKSGVYGGGERARGALPSAWGGANSDQWHKQARGLGAL